MIDYLIELFALHLFSNRCFINFISSEDIAKLNTLQLIGSTLFVSICDLRLIKSSYLLDYVYLMTLFAKEYIIKLLPYLITTALQLIFEVIDSHPYIVD
jgi:hypothetical protein